MRSSQQVRTGALPGVTRINEMGAFSRNTYAADKLKESSLAKLLFTFIKLPYK